MAVVRADKTEIGFRYRPTRAGEFFDLSGYSWLERGSKDSEGDLVPRLRRKSQRLLGRETLLLRRLTEEGWVPMRHSSPSPPGSRSRVRRWIAVPPEYRLRVLKRR